MKLYQLNKNVLTRYENNINDGMFFVYDVSKDSLWTGNISAYFVIRELKKKVSLQFLYENCRDYFENICENDLKNSISEIVSELVNKGYIVEYEAD